MQPANTENTNAGTSRRRFMKNTAVAGAASFAGIHFAAGRVRGANDRLGVGYIGCGGRAGAHMRMVQILRDKQKEPVDPVAACDVYRPRMERAAKRCKIPKSYMDHRELLADASVDVVCIATPDHNHGRQAVDAVKAGKHVYCEKPVSHWSQFVVTKQLARAVADADCAFQLGSQAMSDPVWHQMKKLVADGLIGKPLYAETGFFRIGDWGERGMRIDDPKAKPGPDLDWKGWLGDRPAVPHTVDRQFRWRLFMDYAGGPVTDLYPHCMTQIVDILGVGFPERVVATGGIHRYDYELREVPDTFSLLADYPEKVTISVNGTQGNDFNTPSGKRGAGQRMPYIRGWDGTLFIEKNNKEIVFFPVRKKGAKKPRRIAIEGGEDNVRHWKNLLDCARGTIQRDALYSPMDLAFRTQTALQMAVLGWKEGKVARFDQDKQEIVL